MDFCRNIEFPKFKKPTALRLCRFQEDMRNFTFQLKQYEFYLTVFCVLINIFHFIILTKPAMRTSSVNLIMAAIAFSDICSFLHGIEQLYIRLSRILGNCLETTTYGFVLLEVPFFMLTDFSRRCSTWLCLSIAFIRTLVIRNPMDPFYQNLTKPKTAYFIIIAVFLTGISLGIFKMFEFTIESYDIESCCNSSITIHAFYNRVSDTFLANDAIILNSYHAVDAAFSNLIPCLLFPVVTFLLIKELWKTDENRRKILSTSKTTDSKRTTNLVLVFTFTFFIAQFPFGLNSALGYIFIETPGLM
ncbi:hypothetical protein CRE_08960 [Caenorhabditis remanei]|uniref:G-protein coupled receptors family 1 profile domain-containing protein n=1 Tax=Caenorhabditis remanei TaxID=31234 RepID=E3LIH4_CAERE|nr:hypothetical protein CRE_08960 [Caenorhabditis remanei]